MYCNVLVSTLYEGDSLDCFDCEIVYADISSNISVYRRSLTIQIDIC